jgi:hypothetical protein
VRKRIREGDLVEDWRAQRADFNEITSLFIGVWFRKRRTNLAGWNMNVAASPSAACNGKIFVQ